MKAGIFAALIIVLGGLTSCISKSKQFIYVTGPGTNEIFQFQILNNGSIVPLSQANFGVGSNPVSIVLRPQGDFAFISNFSGNNVTVLQVNRGNGELNTPTTTNPLPPPTPPNIFNTGTNPVSQAVHPGGTFLYVLNQGSGNISAFTIDPTTGNLAIISTSGSNPQPFFGSFTSPTSLTITPSGSLLYVATPSSHTVSGFSIDSKGVLTEVSGSPFNLGVTASPTFVGVDPTGRFLYVADPSSNAIFGFSIGSSGVLTAISGSPFAAGTQPVALATTPAGNLLYVANRGSNNVSAFVIDSGSGALGAVSGSPFPTGGQGPSFVASTGAFVYVGEQVTNDLAAFAIGSNGALTPVPNSPFNVATSPSWVTLLKD